MTAGLAALSETQSYGGGSDTRKNRLHEIVRERSFSEGETKVLASGRQSNFYFNMKRTMAQPEGLALIADLMLEIIDGETCDFIGGLEMGAVPVLNAISMRSFGRDREYPLFWIRKKAKEHGTGELLEGQSLDELNGRTAIMVDDVTTTGGSVLKAIEEVKRNDIGVSTVVTVVDRMEGAAENLAEHGVTLRWLFNADDFRS